MGRPPNQDREIRDKWVHIRYSPKEYETLMYLYRKTHYPSLSAYVRVKSIDKLVIPHSPSSISDDQNKIIIEIRNIRKEINHIGNNINQIAKIANSKKYAGKQELGSLVVELYKIHQILERLENDSKD